MAAGQATMAGAVGRTRIAAAQVRLDLLQKKKGDDHRSQCLDPIDEVISWLHSVKDKGRYISGSSRIGYLPQRPFLPERATVRAAMRLLAPDAERDVLERSLVQVNLWPVLLARSPASPLDTKVGSLSAGEKQRLALARVLARRSPLLLLDEPDANLDQEGLDLLVAILRELAPGHMIAVAAHSPRLIAASDRVLVLGATSAKHGGAGSVEAKPTALQFEGTRS